METCRGVETSLGPQRLSLPEQEIPALLEVIRVDPGQ
jgi:hypothetical protein